MEETKKTLKEIRAERKKIHDKVIKLSCEILLKVTLMNQASIGYWFTFKVHKDRYELITYTNNTQYGYRRDAEINESKPELTLADLEKMMEHLREVDRKHGNKSEKS